MHFHTVPFTDVFFFFVNKRVCSERVTFATNRPLPSSKTLSFKMRPSAQPYYENEFYLHEKEKSLPYQNAQAILGCL